MPKERIGSVWYDPARGCYRIKLTLNDGSRPTVDLTPTVESPLAEKRAREVAAQRSRIAREKNLRAEDFGVKGRTSQGLGGPTPPAPPPAATTATDMAQWADAWTRHRDRRGLSTAHETRDGELRALAWDGGDVDLEHGVLAITRAVMRSGRTKPTKTGESRRFAIEPPCCRSCDRCAARRAARGRSCTCTWTTWRRCCAAGWRLRACAGPSFTKDRPRASR